MFSAGSECNFYAAVYLSCHYICILELAIMPLHMHIGADNVLRWSVSRQLALLNHTWPPVGLPTSRVTSPSNSTCRCTRRRWLCQFTVMFSITLDIQLYPADSCGIFCSLPWTPAVCAAVCCGGSPVRVSKNSDMQLNSLHLVTDVWLLCWWTSTSAECVTPAECDFLCLFWSYDLDMGHLVKTLCIFLRINLVNFVQFKQYESKSGPCVVLF